MPKKKNQQKHKQPAADAPLAVEDSEEDSPREPVNNDAVDARAGNLVTGDDCEHLQVQRKVVPGRFTVFRLLYQPFSWPEVFKYVKFERRGAFQSDSVLHLVRMYNDVRGNDGQERLLAGFSRHLSHMFELHIHDMAMCYALCRGIVRSHQGRECSSAMQHKPLLPGPWKVGSDWVTARSVWEIIKRVSLVDVLDCMNLLCARFDLPKPCLATGVQTDLELLTCNFVEDKVDYEEYRFWLWFGYRTLRNVMTTLMCNIEVLQEPLERLSRNPHFNAVNTIVLVLECRSCQRNHNNLLPFMTPSTLAIVCMANAVRHVCESLVTQRPGNPSINLDAVCDEIGRVPFSSVG